jgi:hypothetical protein
VKQLDISGIKIRNIFKAKIDELEINRKLKNMRDLYKGINAYKSGYKSRNNIV